MKLNVGFLDILDAVLIVTTLTALGLILVGCGFAG